MAAITKKETRLKLQFVANTDHSIHAGLAAVEAMARRFDLWHKVRNSPVWIRAGTRNAATRRRSSSGS